MTDAECGESHAQTHNVIIRSRRTSVCRDVARSRASGGRSNGDEGREPGPRDGSSLAPPPLAASRLGASWLGTSRLAAPSPMGAFRLRLAILRVRLLFAPHLLLRRRVLSLSQLRLAAPSLAQLWMGRPPRMAPSPWLGTSRVGPPPRMGPPRMGASPSLAGSEFPQNHVLILRI